MPKTSVNNDGLDLVRQLGAKYWQPVVTLIASASAIGKVAYDALQGSLTSQTWILIGVAVLIIVVIRFPRLAIRFTRLILGPPPVLTNPRRIFRGPLPYLSGENLPGRQADVDQCFLLLQQEPFFLLEGESGCGKSSILNAALLPLAREKYQVVECRVANDPVDKLSAAMSAYAKPSEGGPAAKPILLCIDQFEELFVTVRDELRDQFLTTLKDQVQRGQLRLLIAIRSDFRDLLMSLCRTVDPEQSVLDLGAYYSLKAFSETQAIAVLDEMLEPIHGGDLLRKQVVDDFAENLVQELLLPPRDPRLSKDDKKTVLPVELQIVGMMIESIGIENFSADGLRRLGGKTELIRAYIEEAKTYVWRKTVVSGDSALLILRQLISPARTKWTQTPKAISNELNIPAQQIKSVLDAFAEKFLVNRLPAEEPSQDPRYELMHEHLVRILVEAPQPILQKARDAEERLEFWRKRTEESWAHAAKIHGCGLFPWIRQQFAQPIPVIESLKLRRFATTSEDQRMLRANLSGFGFKACAIGFLLCLMLGLWHLRIRSDSYQVDALVMRAPVDHLASEKSPKEVVEWIKALIYAGRTEAAFEAVRKIKDTNERSKAFATASIELMKLGDTKMADAAAAQALSIEKFSWNALHSEAVAGLAQHLPSEQVDKLSSLALSKKLESYIYQTQLLSAVAEGMIRAGRNESGSRVFSEAMTTSKLINYSDHRFATLIAVTKRLIDQDRINDASTSLELAIPVARDIKSENAKYNALITAAENYAKIGKIDNAADMLREAFALDLGSWSAEQSTAIATIAEAMARAGKEQQMLSLSRTAKEGYPRNYVLAATATGLCRIRSDEETLSVFDEIKEGSTRFDALVNAATASIENSGMNLAAKLLERASRLLSKTFDYRGRRNPWGIIAEGMFRVGEIEKAIEVGRAYEQIGPISQGYLRMDDPMGPLAQVTKKLAEEGQVDKAYAISKDITIAPDRDHAFMAIVVAEIKAGHIDKAKQIQAQVFAPSRAMSDVSVGSTEGLRFDESLIGIAVAFAGANMLDDAFSVVREIEGSDEKYKGLEGIAKELIKLGKIDEALNAIDKSDDVRRSRSLANLVEWLLDTDKSDRMFMVLPLIRYGDDQSRANAAVAKLHARSGDLLSARQAADSCTSASDSLSACTAILIEYAKRRNPVVGTILKAP